MKFKLFFTFLLVLVLVWRFNSFYSSQPVYYAGQQIELVTVLNVEPELSNKGQRFSFETLRNQRISVTAEPFPRYRDRQVLRMRGELRESVIHGRTFYHLYYPSISIEKPMSNQLTFWAEVVREKSKALYEGTLPPTSASLVMGIVFGAHEHFPKEFFTALRVTGVLHVIAASGMNVTFVSAAILYTLGSIMKRQVALLAGCLGIIFYLFLVGFEPSILRASIMGLLAFGASLFGKQHLAVAAILVSGYLMLLWQPTFLFDLGFQLSFAATLGIIFLQEPIAHSLKHLGKWGTCVSSVITPTVAAQISTLPFLVGVFGTIGIVSLLVNAIVLWTVPIIMLLGSLTAICSLVFPAFGQVLLLLALPFLLFFEFVVSYFGSRMWVVNIDSVPWQFGVAYYLMLLAVIKFRKHADKPLTLEESLALEKY